MAVSLVVAHADDRLRRYLCDQALAAHIDCLETTVDAVADICCPGPDVIVVGPKLKSALGLAEALRARYFTSVIALVGECPKKARDITKFVQLDVLPHTICEKADLGRLILYAFAKREPSAIEIAARLQHTKYTATKIQVARVVIALARVRGNKYAAAKHLGIERQHVALILKHHANEAHDVAERLGVPFEWLMVRSTRGATAMPRPPTRTRVQTKDCRW